MSRATDHLTRLTRTLGEHLGVTHWAISFRVAKRGDFFKRLMDGRDCSTGKYEEILAKLSAMWPEDLEWPADIPRPEEEEDAA